MLNEFKLGTNFDLKILDEIIKLNEEFKDKNVKVTELYGSDRKHSALAARPGFRLPDVSFNDIKVYVEKAKAAGINFNYTMNSIIPYGSKQELVKHATEIINFALKLEEIGVARVTVANPMLLELFKGKFKTMKIECSTIMHIDTVTQIKYLYEKYGVTKICANLNKNRDFGWLEAASKYCSKNGIILELMVNEFCGVGGSNYATHCVYRDSCYICHATNETYEDTLLLNNYPMNLCTNSRNENPANWLKLRFIRPEDIVYYNSIGIHNFKVTGRTGSSEYIIRTMRAYMERKFEGNLISLWKPLESIGNNELENMTVHNIPNHLLEGFIETWVCGKRCDNEVCGETCTYCEWYYERYVKPYMEGGV